MAKKLPIPKRAAVVGTAQSWVQTPWQDAGLLICCLNDAYSMGIPRFDRWYDTHPFDKMIFRTRDQKIDPRTIPPGMFIRPEGHLDWLQAQAQQGKTVYVQEVPEGWPANVKRLPIEDIKPLLRARADQETYLASSPAQIVGHLMLEGYTEIHIYGIHLATQTEYIEQRPQLEFLMGKASALGVTFVLPTDCPLLKHTHVYGYEPAPPPIALAQQQRLMALVQARAAVHDELVKWPRWKSKAAKLVRLRELDSKIHDVQQQIQRAHVYAA